MYERPYELVDGPGGLIARIRARGNDVLRNPMLDRGTAGAVLRGIDSGAVSPEEVTELTGVDHARRQGLARRIQM